MLICCHKETQHHDQFLLSFNYSLFHALKGSEIIASICSTSIFAHCFCHHPVYLIQTHLQIARWKLLVGDCSLCHVLPLQAKHLVVLCSTVPAFFLGDTDVHITDHELNVHCGITFQYLMMFQQNKQKLMKHNQGCF